MKSLYKIIFTAAFGSLLCLPSFALETDTHEKINRYISDHSLNGFSLDLYLKNQMGFAKGTKEKFQQSTVTKELGEWIQIGGKYEDKPDQTLPYIRSVNHFHNPLAPSLGQAGFTGIWDIPHFLSGQSAALWSQKTPSTQSPGGYYSWYDARNYFHSALTSTTPTVRGTNFADTFRGLGQLMHLVQDMSVPEHSRNDGHYTYAYEEWVKDTQNSSVLQRKAIFDTALANPIFFKWSALTQLESAFPGAPVPIANLFDTKQYNGTNPAITVQYLQTITTPTGTITTDIIGLAEYSNVNFVSPDTIFSSNFPNPAKVNTNAQIVEVQAEDGVTDYPYFIFLNGQNYKLAAYSYFANQLPTDVPGSWKYNLNGDVYKDYASLLLPRAVGYSAGLLNYFFRGTLDISVPSTYVYSIIDGADAPYTDVYGNHHQQFTKIRAKVRNTTPNENVGPGTLQAVARYKIIPNYASDLLNYPPDGTVMTGAAYSYSVSASQIITSLSSTTPIEFTFDFTTSPIPAGITDLTLQVVFKGTLGNEADNAVAVGMKDLMEPTHLVFWNLTDMFSLQTGGQYYLYTFDQLKANPDFVALLDTNGDNSLDDELYVQPYPSTFSIAFNDSEPTAQLTPVATAVVPAGRFIRLITLVDRQAPNYVQFTWNDAVDSDWYNATFPGVLNQSDQSGNWQTPTASETFRFGLAADGVTHKPIIQHYYTGILGCHPAQVDAAGNSYCPYPEDESLPANLAPYSATITFP